MLLETPKFEELKTPAVQSIHCPNCGSFAKRQSLASEKTQTECPTCDYFMLTCSRTGSVLEAYAPGLWMR